MSLKKFCPFSGKPCIEDACMFWGIISYYKTCNYEIPKTITEEGCLIQKALKRYTK